MRPCLPAARRRRLNAAMHELRRPLQALTLLVESRMPKDEEARACAVAVRGALLAVDEVVNGTSAAATSAPISISQLLADVEARWRGVAPVSCRVKEVPGAAARGFRGDPAALGRAIDNLVANALEHGSEPVTVEASATNGEVVLAIRDRGLAGAPERRSERDPRRGHGLGIVAEIAEQHGGDALPLRTGPAGTTAALRLPSGPTPSRAGS